MSLGDPTESISSFIHRAYPLIPSFLSPKLQPSGALLLPSILWVEVASTVTTAHGHVSSLACIPPSHPIVTVPSLQPGLGPVVQTYALFTQLSPAVVEQYL